MISAIQKLGLLHLNLESQATKSITSDIVSEILLQNPPMFARVLAEPPGTAAQIRLFVIDVDKGAIIEEEFDEENYGKYLYKKVAAKQRYYAPTFQSTGKLDKKGKIKSDLFFDKWNILPAFSETYHSLREEIITKWTGQSSDKKKTFFTFKVDGKYPGEIDKIAAEFLKSFLANIRTAKQMEASGLGMCSLCLGEKTVFGSAKPYNFYVVEKEGFFDSFSAKNAWKAFPVCESCAFLLQMGATFINLNLESIVATFNVKIVPKFFLFDKILDKIIEERMIEPFKKICELNFFSKELRNVKLEEEIITRTLKALDTLVICDFLIYERKHAAFEVLAVVEDVLPSRLSRIYNAIKETNKKFSSSAFQEIIEEDMSKSKINPRFGFEALPFIMGNLKRKKQKHEYKVLREKQVQLLHQIFSYQKINPKLIFHHVGSRLASNLKTGKRVNFLTTKTFQLLYFLDILGILDLKTGKKEKELPAGVNMLQISHEQLEGFFKEYSHFFPAAEEKTTFLVGILYGRLERVQFAKYKKSAPIQKHLHSLDLSEKQLKRLYTEIIKKMKEYTRPFKVFTKQVATFTEYLDSQWLATTRPWQISRDELKFYFCLGWTLSRKFLPSRSGKTDIQEND